MNYEITITEREIIVDTFICNGYYSKRKYEYCSYEFSRMNDKYSDAQQVFMIRTIDGGLIKYNASNISSIEINKNK
jgi:hypothetical protein